MSRVVVLGLGLVIAALPPACQKLLGKGGAAPADTTAATATGDPPPPPPPSGAATAPPIWNANPNVTPSLTALPPPPPPSDDLGKAQAAFDAKDYKKAKGFLDKKVKAGKCVPDEVTLLLKTCQQLKDKTCVSDTKKACPPLGTTSNEVPQKGLGL